MTPTVQVLESIEGHPVLVQLSPYNKAVLCRTLKQAALLDYFEGVAAGPGQFRRARRLMQRTGGGYAEVFSRAGRLVAVVTRRANWLRSLTRGWRRGPILESLFAHEPRVPR